MILPVDDPTSLSLLYHLNSEPWLNDAAYEAAGTQEPLAGLDGAPVVTLPPAGESPLTALLRRRRSARAFASRPLPLAALSAVAAAAQGVVEAMRMEDGTGLVRRSAPSAGGLFPLELYVLARRIDGLDDGVYRYESHGHALAELERGDPTPGLAPALYAFPFVAEANVVLALAARFARTQRKYGPRGYRYMLLEAGHAAQNVCLRAAELGLASLCVGGFVDSDMNTILGLEATEAGVLYMVAVGHPAG
jgi:SagB-type dehydrogenase family enzyme